MKYVLVSGGVISGVGKGIIASSTGLLLKTSGLKVTSIKIDPYMNIDAGTMSPIEHGECYVLDDGGECDLDLGNYERYLHITLRRDNNITTGKIYQQVIAAERRGDYLGKTVQVVPHVTGAIEEWVQRVARVPVDDSGEEPDVCVIELGGTVGDIESAPFIHAMTQLQRNVGKNNFFQIHVSYVPVIPPDICRQGRRRQAHGDYEIKDHPWFVGVQFHPEYISRVLAPSKSYLGFFAAAAGCLEAITKEFSGRFDLSHLRVALPEDASVNETNKI